MPDPDDSKPFADEHSCRLQDPDEFDDFRREDDAATVMGRSVDFIFGLTDDGDSSELQAIRYPLAEGWDADEAREHCTEQDSIMFEPAEGEDGTTNHAMRTTKSPGGRTVTTTTRAESVVTREVDDEEIEMLRVPISSTHEDRDGDAFSEDALQRMAQQIRTERPLVHDDHGHVGAGMGRYSARETIGTQMDAEVVGDEDGGDHATLFAYINPDGTHPDGEGDRMLRQVKDEKQAIKFSVGFGILRVAEDLPEEERPERASEVPGRLFMEADLMETSRVGIPANPVASAGGGIEIAKDAAEAGRVPVAFLTPDELAQVDRDVVGDATPTRVDGQGQTTTKDHDMTQPNETDDGGEDSTDKKAPEDIGPADFAEYVASHYDGLDAADVTDALDEAGGDYVGAVDMAELAAHVAAVVDEETGTVSDTLDDLMGGDGDGDEESASEAEGGEPDDADADTPDATDGTTPEGELAELREEIDQLRDAIDERGEPETGATTDTGVPPETEDADDDTDDSDTETNTDHETIFQ